MEGTSGSITPLDPLGLLLSGECQAHFDLEDLRKGS